MKVLIADDHPLFRDALKEVVAGALPDSDVVEAQDFNAAQSVVAADDSVGLILLDLNMPGMDGLAGLTALRDESPATPIVVVSATEDGDTVDRVLICGASGFISKSMPKDGMIAAITAVMSGEIFRAIPSPDERSSGNRVTPDMLDRVSALTRKQRLVLSLIAKGKSNKIIAYELSVTDATVKAHVTAILRKLRVTSRTQAAILAREIERVN